jgi:hypothetical protein
MDIKYFYCAFCEYKTKRKHDLNRHQNAMHPKNVMNEIQNENVNLKDNVLFKEENVLFKEENVDLEEIQEDIDEIKSKEIYKCNKCQKNYKTIKYLINHQKSCNGLSVLTCPKCMFTFTSRFSKSNHIKKNNCKAKSIIHGINPDVKNETNINGNYNTININNITNNYINNYGSERTDHITYDEILKIIFNSCDYIIPKYIELKHYNKDFPENHNIKYDKIKGCSIKNDDKWNVADIDYISDNLFNKNSSELIKFYNNYKKDIDIIIKKKEENYVKKELFQYIYLRFNYLDLSVNKKMFNNIKTQIKHIIKHNNFI